MTPRDAAIQAYADAERRLREKSRELVGQPLTQRSIRQKAVIVHRAMLAELTDPEPAKLRRTA